MADITCTTRAYTIRLTGDGNWRDQLWSTHVAVNRGAWAWGDWLLTLRGGLPASLAKDHPERRVLLALSWFSVESPATLVNAPIVAGGKDEDRQEKVLTAFRQVLKANNVTNIEDWVAACEPTLSARIRDDAIWVNRHAAFTQMTKTYQGLTSTWARQTLFDLLGGETDYFTMPEDMEAAPAEAKDFVQKAGGWLSRNWGSGEKSDASSIAVALESIAAMDPEPMIGKSGLVAIQAVHIRIGPCEVKDVTAEAVFKSLKQRVGWKGRSSKGALALENLSKAEIVDVDLWQRTRTKLQEEASDQAAKTSKRGSKPDWMDNWRATMEGSTWISMPFRAGRDLIWEHGVMLDHALRRVSSAHTWIKRAEFERRKFEQEAIKEVPSAARGWLDGFCEQRAEDTGGIATEYVIRKSALDGWDRVVHAWSRLDKNATAADRIRAAHDIQSNLDDNEKFGDATLFERLADEDAIGVWQDDKGKANAQILKDYSAAQTAKHNQKRFKVPAYRHPDPLRNPIYVDFGNSRWSIEYSALKEAQNRPKLQQQLATAKSEKVKEKVRTQLNIKPNLREVKLGLWTGDAIIPTTLRWQGKRLWNDLDLDHFDQPGESTVTRADRLGRVSRDASSGAVTIAEVFGAKDWNGRLQVSRKQLDRLADLVYGTEKFAIDGKTITVRHGADYAKLNTLPSHPRAVKQFNHLRWFLTTSAKLKPSGPWWEYVAQELPEGIEFNNKRKYLNYAANQGRKGRARLLLADLPSLRVLSFDLGHRYGAACAVWETLTEDALRQEIEGRTITSGSLEPSSLYLHTEHAGGDGKPRRTIYRRTSVNMWARLERQFTIKLQGEERASRWALPEEMEGFERFREYLGLPSLGSLGIEKLRIDVLQKETVREARTGLRRLGDVARIAFAMTANSKPLSGGRTSSPFTVQERIEYVAEALARWQQLVRKGIESKDLWAIDKWQQYVIDRCGGAEPAGETEDVSPAARKRNAKQAVEQLKAVAKRLIDHKGLADELHHLWEEHYRVLEQHWKSHLRWVRQLILPRKGHFKKGHKNVGGLSVGRLQAIRGVYETLRAFRMRPEPDNLTKNVPALNDESLARFGHRILGQLERLREQRIKQLASRIVEAALGAGRIKSPRGRDRKRPTRAIDRPCHVVVAENLEHYRPEETRLRRENRRLMDWAARNVRKYIMEGCELNGLHFEEVSAAYTSQQDSRTGAPGIRCEDVSLDVLRAVASGDGSPLRSFDQIRQVQWLKREHQKALKEEGTCNPRLSLLLRVVGEAPQGFNGRQSARLPKRGGELFVSADATSPTAKGLQADLNAAANIGLRALMHPDYLGTWWYVLVDRKTGVPIVDKVKGCPLWDSAPQLSPGEPSSSDTGKGKREKDKVYAWNPFDGSLSNWKTTGDYKREVELQVAQILMRQQLDADAPW